MNLRVLRTSTVIREDNALYAMLVGEYRVFNALDPLDNHREVCQFPYPSENVPVDGWGDGASRDLCNTLTLSVTVLCLFLLVLICRSAKDFRHLQ